MYLKSLVLKGFKSFADRSVLRLEPGMTVVVGPNGSGKSNISDAVLWVLGEQSAKQLRGQAMEDVIFAGSSARKAVGLAEVDLVLDNSDGTLPLDFAEVVITRRMYRSGESEYLINGSKTRLMDVLDILNDSGLGRDTHSIISQGALQDMLHARPEQRRALIEEAAGILKHKKRKERAGRKLKGMDAALTRVNDIAGEIDRQLRPLKRQASRAKQHEELSSELKELQLVLAVDDLRGLKKKWEAADKDERERSASVEIAKLKADAKSEELEKCQRLLEQKGIYVGDLAELRRKSQMSVERADAGLSLLEEKGRNMVSRLSELRQSVHRFEARGQEAKANLESCEAQLAAAKASFDELEHQVAEHNAKAAKLDEKRQRADKRVTEVSAQVRTCEKNIDECVLELARANEALSGAGVKDALFEQRQVQIEDTLATTKAALTSNKERLEKLAQAIKKLTKESDLKEAAVEKCMRELEEARDALKKARESFHALQAERQALSEVDRAFDDANPLLSWSLDNKDDIEGIVSAASDLFGAPEELEGLVEFLLGSDLYGLLVDTPDHAGALASRLTKANIDKGRITLLPIEGKQLKRPKAKTGTPLLEMLTYDPSCERVAEALLGDVYLVDGIEAAIEASGKDATGSRFVTRNGVVAWPDGKITLGTQELDTQGVLARKRRLNALAKEEPKANKAYEQAQKDLEAAELASTKAREDVISVSQSIAQEQGQEKSLQKEVGRLEQTATSLEAELEQVHASRIELAEQNTEALKNSTKIKKRREALEKDLSELAEKAEQAKEERRRILEEADIASRSASAAKVDLATVRERKSNLERRISQLEGDIAEFDRSMEVTRRTQIALEALNRRVDPLHRVLSELKSGIDEKARGLQEQARLEQAGTGDLRDTIEELRRQVADAQKQLDVANGALSDVRVEKGRLEVMVEQAVKCITEEHGVMLDIALEIPAPENHEAAQAKAAKLSRRLTALGAVNPIALDEYQRLKERKDFIAVQLEDLQAASKALQRIVGAIDRKLRQSFLTTFEQVNENFQEIFTTLFPGGKGYLELSDPSNPEETGIDVHAQPRGKAVRKQTLLSGGEQSLVAMSLLFAVYKVRSTPFYILDEVEAALDDTNLRRMLAYLDSIRATTQFIIISHQRRTMEMADLLYGVSMRGDGVSKLVSQRLDQAVRLARKPEEHVDVEEFSGAGTGDRDAGNV